MAPEEYIHFIKVHEFVVRTMGSNLHRIALGLTCAWTLALRPVLARAPLSMPQVKARYYTHKEMYTQQAKVNPVESYSVKSCSMQLQAIFVPTCISRPR